MSHPLSSLGLGIGGVTLGVALAVCLVTPTGVFAQTQPTFPSQLPVPKTAGPAQAPAAAEAAKPAPTPAAAPAPAAGGSGARDPFDPLIAPPGPNEERKVQQFSNLKLVGVIWDTVNRDQIRALVETPDGLGYYVRMNEERFGGKVIAIQRDRVKFSVREQVPGSAARERMVELKLGGQ